MSAHTTVFGPPTFGLTLFFFPWAVYNNVYGINRQAVYSCGHCRIIQLALKALGGKAFGFVQCAL